MPGFINLANLNGRNGFVINGSDQGDQLGWSVSAAGDINGDGIADFVVSAISADPGGQDAAGEIYVIFGNDGGFGDSFDLSSLNGDNGFILRGADPGDLAGSSVSAAGDLNGDGIDDVLIGSPLADAGNRVDAGNAYVFYGSTDDFVFIYDLGALNASNGFTINGRDAGDGAGISVALAGDVNGDGRSDILVGADNREHQSLPNTGTTHVVFGADDGFGEALNVSQLNGSNGFSINGFEPFGFSGRSVAGAGDINGDGYDDIIIGAPLVEHQDQVFFPDAGSAYVVFGSEDGFAANFSLQNLNGSNGFAIKGFEHFSLVGSSVSGAGDINGDGIDDFLVGASGVSSSGFDNGAVYVIFGRTDGWDAEIDLEALDGTDGFAILGLNGNDELGAQVNRAGDVNGDGVDDIIVTAPGAGDDGTSYVIFGSAEGFSASFDLSALDGTNGFAFNAGAAANAAGDINNDGYDDIIVGAPSTNDSTGAVYVIYGAESVGQETIDFGSNADDDLLGGAFPDTLSGGNGDDTLEGAGNGDIIDGGAGSDTASYENAPSAVTVDLSANGGSVGDAAGDQFTSIENLAGSAFADTLTGDVAANRLSGLAGDDTLTGGDGADTLDGGDGADTANYADSASAVTVNLDSGVVTGGTAAGDTLVNIENVTGSALADQLVGDEGANGLRGEAGNDTLTGGAGDDTLSGGAGDDTFISGAGADVMVGGDGIDTATYAASAGAVTVNLGTGSFSRGDAAGDDLSGIENVIGTSFADRLAGDASDNVLIGADGDDTLVGADGNDIAEGGIGNDIFFAGANDTGNDLFVGGEGADLVGGGAGNDLLVGDTARADALSGDFNGTTASDTIFGGDGDDTLLGGGWIDDNGDGDFDDEEQRSSTSDPNVLFGGAGDDLVYGDSGDDTLGGGAGNDTLFGGAGRDLFFGGKGEEENDDFISGGTSQDTIFGSDGDDTVNGGGASDQVFGGAGADVVDGGDASDSLFGGTGDDTITGGAGVDTFFFANNHGADTVTDFDTDDDILFLANTLTDFTSLTDVQAAATETSQGGQTGLLIDTGGGNSVFLIGVDLNDLTADNLAL